ncbi:unnamed protein product [Somion occarium]|uniref:Ribosomal protein L2 n=1 Tax=Somion occarium TaxID=3059160 RepID=A0ABP1CTQ6_9APHY
MITAVWRARTIRRQESYQAGHQNSKSKSAKRHSNSFDFNPLKLAFAFQRHQPLLFSSNRYSLDFGCSRAGSSNVSVPLGRTGNYGVRHKEILVLKSVQWPAFG